jgi:hypothetical protein
MNTLAERQAAYRERMKEKGYKLKTIWVDAAGLPVNLSERKKTLLDLLKECLQNKMTEKLKSTENKLKEAEAEIRVLKQKMKGLADIIINGDG